ncbi:MAG: DUF1573 domain-containing protein [Bacteroidales bacterium]|jgi:hypothetical protein|nr:DUF1573 domain-containing protein [Bacteroidales bacterium]
MKKIFSLAIVLLAFGLMQAQEVKKEVPKQYKGAEISLDKLTHNFGKLKVGEVKEGIFTFTNVGVKPLIIEDAIASCDCTVMSWTQTPVMPGQKGTIKATYTAKNVGPISKRITVLSTAETDRLILQIKGEVIE